MFAFKFSVGDIVRVTRGEPRDFVGVVEEVLTQEVGTPDGKILSLVGVSGLKDR